MPKIDTICVGKEEMETVWYVYAIQHDVTKRVYVGCAHNIHFRYLSHLRELKGHRHKSQRMQEDFDKYGACYTITKLDEAKDGWERINGRPYAYRTLKELGWMMRLNSVEEGYNSQDRTAKRTISAHFVNFEDYIGEVQV